MRLCSYVIALNGVVCLDSANFYETLNVPLPDTISMYYAKFEIEVRVIDKTK